MLESDVNCTKQESVPMFSAPCTSQYIAAATHPAVCLRNKDDLFKRIRSGNDVLCKLPTRLDPNLMFSDDDDDEEEENDNNAAMDKTPEAPNFKTPSKSSGTKIPRLQQQAHSGKRIPLSECKPPQRRNSNPPPEVPHSDFKKKNLKMSLMSQPEFKVPFEKPKKGNASEIVVVNKKPYTVFAILGSGGSCKVFDALTSDKTLVALKCVDLKNADPTIREGYKKEIEYLQMLQGSNRVIRMYDFEYRENELFLVLERGDIDFARYISNEAKLKRLTPLMIKFYWQQMLEAVSDIHRYGIVHSDLKPANFLLVAGNLKLIDFGIATSVPDDRTSILRESQVGTLNYMSPEAVTQFSTPGTQQICFRVGVKSDVWSLGCILYNLVYGLTPFHKVKHILQKITAITSPQHPISFPPLPDPRLHNVLFLCLQRNPKERASVEQLLKHPYLTQEDTKSTTQPENELVQQMQGLTPRRMGILARMVQELSTQGKEKNETERPQ